MAESPELAEFYYKACVDRINKYKEGGESEDAMLVLCEWLSSFRKDGYITDAQLKGLTDMLGVDVEVPDAGDSYKEELASVREQVAEQAQTLSDHEDAIVELGDIVSGIIEPEEA